MNILPLLDRPIAFQRSFIRLDIGVTAALFLSQMTYWTNRSDDDGWVYKTQEEWEEETGLSRYEQEGARKKLRSIGVLLEKRKGVPARLFYKVDNNVLYQVLVAANKNAEKPHTGVRKTTKQVRGKPANFLTENTTENIDPSKSPVGRGEGHVLREQLISLLEGQFDFDKAGELHDAVEAVIVGAGFDCQREYPVTINDMGTIEMTQITTRFGDTVWDVPEAGTRNALMADYGVFVPVEKRDLRKLIADPQGPYLQLTLSAANRKKDDVIYRALLDAVLRKTENNGAYASVTLPASQKIVAGGTGMTKAKLIAAKAMFRRNECDEQNGEELYMTYNADMLTQILSDTTLTSADFMAVKMLQEGAVNGNWLGFKWLAYEKLDSVTAESVTTKTAAAWCKSAVHFGTGAEYNVDIWFWGRYRTGSRTSTA